MPALRPHVDLLRDADVSPLVHVAAWGQAGAQQTCQAVGISLISLEMIDFVGKGC